ncbi:outer membrane channel protein TolC [Thiomicrorhabdus hydrogeniphila]
MKSNKVNSVQMIGVKADLIQKNRTKRVAKFSYTAIAGVVLALNSSLSYAEGLGLQDVYQMALQHDATLAQAESQFNADSESVATAKSALLPHITADGSYYVTDSSYDPSDNHARDLSLNLNQPLYQHDSWARYEQAKYTVDLADATLRNAQQDLILRVTQAYFDVLLAQQNLRLSQTKEKADYTNYETAQASAELGLSSKVDVLQAKSSYDLSKSETISVENSLNVALEALSKLTGQPVIRFEKNNLKQLMPNVVLPPEKRPVYQLVKQAETNNLQVKQSEAQLSSATEEIEVQRGGYYPTVSLKASYSDTAYSDFDTNYTSSYNDKNTTSVGVVVSMPLYSGGGTNSQVAAAKYQTMASQEALRDAKESAKLNVRTLKRNLEQGHKLIAALREAVKSNDAFLESAEEGYKVGLKSMLEVLTARTNQTSAHKNLIEAIHNQVINKLNLEASLGDLTVDDIMKYEPLLQSVN